MRLSSTLSTRILKAPCDGNSSTSLRTLLQWLIILTVKKYIYIISYIETKPLMVQLFLLCEERASILF